MFNEVFTLTLDRSFESSFDDRRANAKRYQVRIALGHGETDDYRIDAIRRISEQIIDLYRKDNGIIGGPEDDAKGKMLIGAISRMADAVTRKNEASKPKKTKAEPKKEEEPKRKLEEIIPL